MALGEKLRAAMEKLKASAVLDKAALKEVVKEIQRALIGSDVEVSMVLELSKRIEEEALKDPPKGMTRKEHAIKKTYDLLVETLGGEKPGLEKDPEKILLVGTFGHGKTTTANKLARHYSKRGKKVGLLCADTYRPAAFEQLKQLAEKSGAEFYGDQKEKKAAKVVEKGLKELKDCSLVIVDSAGRSALDRELVEEIKEVHSALKPDLNFLVLGADIGQIAKKQAKAFHEAAGVNGVILTKMDGSAKGGGALAACAATKSPVYFLGTGEKPEDLEEFEAQRFLGRILGYGDLKGLLEKAKEIELEEELSPEQLFKGKFNLKTFYAQLKAARKLGPLHKVAEMMGLSMQIPKDQLEVGEEKLDSFKVIIDSMTEEERINPEIMNRSRIQRASRGSGKKEADVRELLKRFKQMKAMFKKFKKIGDMENMDQKKIAKLMKGMKGFGKQKKLKIR